MSDPGGDDFLRAATCHREGRLEDAVALYERVIAATPDHGGAWTNLGAAHRQLGHVNAIIAPASLRFKVGIVWSGSLTFKTNAQRRAPIEHFIGLAEIPGIQLFSLQKGPAAAELSTAGATALVTDLAPGRVYLGR